MATQLNTPKQAFMQNIAQRLGRPTPQAPPPRPLIGPPEYWTKLDSNRETLIKQFCENLQTLTGKALLVPDKTLLQEQIRFWLGELKAKSIICWNTPQLQASGISETCAQAGLKVTLWDPAQDRQEMIRQCAGVDVGITWADYAIATTGTIALFSSALQGRSPSLLPPVHIAVVNTDRLVPRMGDVLKVMASKNASAVNFITGPSRTSDIEMDLSVGVHGPGKVFVALLDQPSSV